ncbi:Maf family protein [Methylophaga nitratireducenticrescens]|uniref:Maf family protein n=1 Tax=Methylophaga nitratireducenticrescens TaxID=754476 RepID=UPI000CDC009C|nr:nucleoside triphosphate pyrophosphatase [Methylophaga nitratireducenticrescens]AUZ84201.1 septum formation inhibitor Maf [Methylophaga nitratireducenticrescens]
MKFPKVYLASASPRRRELLTQIGVDFSVLNVSVDESVLAAEMPSDYAKRIALAKAQAGWETLKTDYRPVIGADTAVVLPSQHILGKPENLQQAEAFLRQLSANSHQVLSAVAIVWQQQHWLSLQISDVQFKKLSSAEIDWYLATGEGKDKAGGYAVQGLAAMFIENIKGSYSGVMGLPLFETSQLLQQVNIFNEQ